MLAAGQAPETAASALPWIEFAIALAIGGLIGVEREKKKLGGEIGTRGLRTFVLIAEAGAIGAWLSTSLESAWIFAVGAALVAAIVMVGYWLQVRASPEALGMTTEVASLVTYLLGGLVVFGYPELAAALAIATSALLAFKEPLVGLVERIGREDLQAGLKLLIATFIVLPVLPDRPIDPWGTLNPYAMWWLVILIAGLSMAGYVATRWLGPERGLAVTGLVGGMVSSTAVTLGLARESRERGRSPPPAALAVGLLLAWVVMFARIGIEVAVVHVALVGRLLPPLAAMGLAALGAAAVLHWKGGRGAEAGAPEVKLRNPFSLAASIRFALIFSVILVVVALTREYLPEAGLYLVAALAGTADVDAITLSMAEYARDGGGEGLAAGSIMVAALSNTLVKCVLVAVLGSRELRARVLPAAGIVLASGAVALAVA